MDLGLKGRVALVTAASKGIGLGVARVLAAEGMKVAISSRTSSDLEKARVMLEEESGSEVLAVQADMTRRDDLERLVKRTADALGGVDVLAYNSGPPKTGTFADLSYQDWEEATRLLLLSAVTLTGAVVPGMRSRRWGRLVYITSFTLKQPVANLVLSNTVRLGVAGLSKSLSRELAPDGITSNVIVQGFVRSDRMLHIVEERAARSGATVEETYKEMAKTIPLGRYAEPEELGSLVAFIASEKGSYLNGGVFTIDGGYVSSVF
ncbi:MAG: SDR family oxidoreductase [Nitrososphaerota archaeon]|nr:SDR family oxidoreductase [Nitrososphaerota archaeon]MDG6977922.1 SDR family oxidoreductase [Nitrososphaerota archaeon]MDG7005841.1 SDR family oxidoreductase [Nitrososphaerota archaeon]MDG7020844.1 SDR family oxidoreductase [Nitrososphaerota archaeon]